MGSTAVREMLPTIVSNRLAGGVEYFDGQFDDARYSLALAQTLESLGGTAINYAKMIRLLKTKDVVSGVVIRDQETGTEFEVQARVVINATGVFTDEVRLLDEPQAPPMLTVSQGSHFVLPKSFLPGTHALMVPKPWTGECSLPSRGTGRWWWAPRTRPSQVHHSSRERWRWRLRFSATTWSSTLAARPRMLRCSVCGLD